MSKVSVLPGQWVGMFGGGQLGRMFTHAAQRMGYHVAVFDHQEDCPAAQAADFHFRPNSEEAIDVDTLRAFGQRCQVSTLEFENIDTAIVEKAAEWTNTFPGADFLALCQDRIREKGLLSRGGFPTTPFMPVSSAEDVTKAAESLGWPLVLKTATAGYDGKGQLVLRSAVELDTAWASLGTTHVIAEQWIEFEAEVSMITARNPSGQMVSYPLFENTHSNHILDITRCPVRPSLAACEKEANQICQGIAEAFSVVGLFCVEFFVTRDGRLMINEIAPRPHNSGHLTMEAFTCGQFEQQLRAVCDLPLAETRQVKPAAMVNLLGDLWFESHNQTSDIEVELDLSRPLGYVPNWAKVLESSEAFLHLYGKAEARRGRKMGHITVTDENAELAATRAASLREDLRTNCNH